MAGDYIKCPRCELNYIHKSQDYCDVCKAELKMGPQLVFAVEEDDDEEPLELCPICKLTYIREGEEMCAKCREELEFKTGEIDIEADEEWKNYLDDDAEDEEEESEEMVSLSMLAEEESDELFDDEDIDEFDDVVPVEPDDFEIPELDEEDFEIDDDEDEDEDLEDDDDLF